MSDYESLLPKIQGKTLVVRDLQPMSGFDYEYMSELRAIYDAAPVATQTPRHYNCCCRFILVSEGQTVDFHDWFLAERRRKYLPVLLLAAAVIVFALSWR